MNKYENTEEGEEVKKKIVPPIEWGSEDEDLRDVIEKQKGNKRKK